MSSKGKKNTKNTKSTPKKGSKKIDTTQLKKDTQLIPIEEWDWAKVVYSEPSKKEIPDGSGHYRQVQISYMYDKKTIGPAIVELGKHYCFGVQPDNTDKDGNILKDKNTGKEKQLRGYKVPIVMTSQNKDTPDPTEEEQREVDFFDDWKNEVVRYATENKKAIGKGAKNDALIEGLVGDILYRKTDGEDMILEGVAPKLYGNLIYFANKREVGTAFYGPGDKDVNPLTMTSHLYIYPTIRFDHIFIGGKNISLKHRVYDATVEPVSRAPKKRLARPNTMEPVEEGEEVSADEDDDANEMMESDED